MSLSEEETNYLRLAILVIKLSPKALRVLFDNRFPPVDLANIVTRKRGKLQKLYTNKIINQAQWDILLPAAGTITSSQAYDITLLILLLRNIAAPPVLKPLTGFDQLPLQNDTTEGADMARIKFYRNMISHFTNAELSNTEFNDAWNNIVQAIRRLGGGRYDQDCSDLRVACLDGTDREVYKEVKDTQQALEQLKKELKDETVRWNVKERHDRKIQKWEEVDKKYAVTMVSDAVMAAVEQNRCILITGNSGAGKSALTHHVALQLRQKGYRILPIIQPGEITLYHNPNIQQVVVCDDLCGKYYADKSLIEEWIRYEEELKMIFENGDMKLILNSRLIVSQDEHFKMMSFLSPFVVSLSNPQYKFSINEKKAILKKHLPEDEEVNVSIDRVGSLDCFPLLCELFGENDSLWTDPESFFSRPFEGYSQDIEKLKRNYPMKYCSLAVLVVFEDHVNENILTHFDIQPEIQDKFDFIYHELGITRGTARSKIKEELDSLVNIYVWKSQGEIRSLHDKMFEFLSAQIGPQVGHCLLKYSSCSFIRERIRLVTALDDDDENIIILPNDLERSYFERMYKDILDGNIKEVFFNKQIQQCLFEEAMIRQLGQLDDEEFEKFIKTEGKYPHISMKYWSRRDSKFDPFSVLDRMADDLDEVAKFHLAYTYSLLYQEKTCTFHWMLARGLHKLFLFVERRMPDYVRQIIMDNYNLCISLSILEEKTDILEEILTKYPHDAAVDVQDDKRYYPLFLFVCFTGNLGLVEYLHKKDHIYPEKTETGESAVWIAAFAGQLEVLKFLVSKNFNIDSENNDKATPLLIACQRGHYSIVEYLLQNNANVNLCKKNGTSPLFVACQEGHFKIAELLLASNADVNKLKFGKGLALDKNTTGVSPLFVACKNGHMDVVQLLLSHKANTELCMDNGKTPLLVAIQNGYHDIANRLIQRRANVNCKMDNGLCPLIVAAGKGQTDLIQILLKNGAHVNIVMIVETADYKTPAYVVNGTNYNPPSPLIMASMNNHLEIVSILVENGADIDYRGIEGATALFEAADKGHLEIIKYLLSKNASVNIATYSKRTPLFVAMQRRSIDCVEELLKSSGVDVNLCREDGASPLLMATLHGQSKLVEHLLMLKANPNLATVEGLYPLMSAAKLGNCDIMKQLVGSGASVECKNQNKQTPLWIAAHYGNSKCVEYLLDREADINACDKFGESVLLAACNQEDLSIVQLLVERCADINHCNNEGITPLVRATQVGNIKIVEYLLDHGSNVNAHTKNNVTAVMIAVEKSNKAILKVLLGYQPDLKISDSNGQTALWIAVIKGDLDMVIALVDSGANVNYSLKGMTLLQLANEMGHLEIEHLLYQRQGHLRRLLKTFGWLIFGFSKINGFI